MTGKSWRGDGGSGQGGEDRAGSVAADSGGCGRTGGGTAAHAGGRGALRRGQPGGVHGGWIELPAGADRGSGSEKQGRRSAGGGGVPQIWRSGAFAGRRHQPGGTVLQRGGGD